MPDVPGGLMVAEHRRRKRNWVGGLGLAAALLALSPSGARAGIILSTDLDAELGGLSFLNGSLLIITSLVGQKSSSLRSNAFPCVCLTF